ncbi:hypothetical protein [Ferrimonas pelagia]|uniref:DUF4178 domain-containing protein n=1 Tax=Ferrimonas pelagia TaxID=1177826 RepID=A0ABP9ESV1_9GAMM
MKAVFEVAGKPFEVTFNGTGFERYHYNGDVLLERYSWAFNGDLEFVVDGHVVWFICRNAQIMVVVDDELVTENIVRDMQEDKKAQGYQLVKRSFDVAGKPFEVVLDDGKQIYRYAGKTLLQRRTWISCDDIGFDVAEHHVDFLNRGDALEVLVDGTVQIERLDKMPERHHFSVWRGPIPIWGVQLLMLCMALIGVLLDPALLIFIPNLVGWVVIHSTIFSLLLLRWDDQFIYLFYPCVSLPMFFRELDVEGSVTGDWQWYALMFGAVALFWALSRMLVKGGISLIERMWPHKAPWRRRTQFGFGYWLALSVINATSIQFMLAWFDWYTATGVAAVC